MIKNYSENLNQKITMDSHPNHCINYGFLGEKNQLGKLTTWVYKMRYRRVHSGCLKTAEIEGPKAAQSKKVEALEQEG